MNNFAVVDQTAKHAEDIILIGKPGRDGLPFWVQFAMEQCFACQRAKRGSVFARGIVAPLARQSRNTATDKFFDNPLRRGAAGPRPGVAFDRGWGAPRR